MNYPVSFHKTAMVCLAPLILCLLGCAQLSLREAPVRHRFICVDNGQGRLIHIDQRHPNRNWQVEIPKASRDLQLLAGGRVLVGHETGCGVYRLRDGLCLARVEGFTGVVTAFCLEDRGELWLGANAAAGYEFYVLRREGDGFVNTGQTHRAPFKTGFLRLARPTAQGRLLFAAGTPYKIVEWDPRTGRTVWEAPLPGKGYAAVRRPDGTTAASTSDAVSVVLFDRDGKVLRTWLGEAYKEQYRLSSVSGFDFLKNGNLVACNWLGHNAHGTGPHLVEVDGRNRLAWSWEDHTLAQQITNCLVLDDLPAEQ